MRIILYGAGFFFEQKYDELKKIIGDDIIVAFSDKRAEELGRIDNISVVFPQDISKLEYDNIIVMSLYYSEILV